MSPKRSPRLTRIIPSVLAAALFAGACTSDAPDEATNERVDIDPSSIVLTSGLDVPVDCDALLARLVAEGVERVGPYGLNGDQYWFGDDIAMEDEEAMADSASDSAGGVAPSTTTAAPQSAGESSSDGGDFSGTNNQEIGVDEPDLVKTDGERLVVISGTKLTVIDTTGGAPEVTREIELPNDVYASEMFLAGDRAFLMAHGWSDVGFAHDVAIVNGINTTQLIEVDLTTGDVGDILEFEGHHLSAREIDGTIRFVIWSSIGHFPFVYPSNQAAEDGAEAANRAIIEESTIEQWLPGYRITHPDGTTEQSSLFDCDQMHLPAEFSGFGSVSVLTVDADAEGLSLSDSLGVLTDGQTIYASTDRLTVATAQYPEWDENGIPVEDTDYSTALHSFDITDPTSTAYVGSGGVPGYLLSQYSLSEHNGYLRVATTAGDPWSGEQSESLVTVLSEDNGELVTVGQVDGLGKGERIFAVRFMGDVGYVVTFRQVDPLYVLDLSDPTDPTVTGELKIPGFSTYLHPVGEGQLMGVGQDATDEGMTTGAQVSMFDVSDMTEPIRVDQLDLGANSHSSVDWDPRAFTWWGPERIAFVPISWYGWDEETDEDQSGSASVVVAVGDDGSLVELGRIQHPANRECESDYWEDEPSRPIEEPTNGSTETTIPEAEEDRAEEELVEEEPAEEEEAAEQSEDAEANLVEDRVAPAEEPAPASTTTIAPPPDDAPDAIAPSDEPQYEDYCWTYQAEIRRSVVIGDVVYTVSDAGVQANDLMDFSFIGWVELNNR